MQKSFFKHRVRNASTGCVSSSSKILSGFKLVNSNQMVAFHEDNSVSVLQRDGPTVKLVHNLTAKDFFVCDNAGRLRASGEGSFCSD